MKLGLLITDLRTHYAMPGADPIHEGHAVANRRPARDPRNRAAVCGRVSPKFSAIAPHTSARVAPLSVREWDGRSRHDA